MFFILSGIGTEPDEPDNAGHVAYIRDQLAQSDAPWKICSWHKNQTLMQVGNKDNEVGWAAYETCREQGAIVATAPLARTDTACTVHVDRGEMKVQDGPYAETREQLGGYYIIRAENMDEAIKWAARCPAATWGTIEVRQIINLGDE